VKLPTKKTDGNVLLSELRLLLFGPPKVGKTTMVSEFPGVIYLATEKGYKSLKVHKIDIKSWGDFCDAVNTLTKTSHQFKTVVIDTIDILWNLCVEKVCTELEIEHPSDEDWGKGYDIISKTFEKEINKLFLSDMGVILISHTKTVELVNRVGKITKIVATLSNTARRIILPKVESIGYMGLKMLKNKNGDFIERRILSFAPSETLEAGDRTGKFPEEFIVPEDPRKTYQFFRDAFDQ